LIDAFTTSLAFTYLAHFCAILQLWARRSAKPMMPLFFEVQY
jgi:hypothetical protein